MENKPRPHRNYPDLRGQIFGRWKVIKPIFGITKNIHWECRCECGEKGLVKTQALRSGDSRSCGCLHREIIIKLFTTHGMTGSKEHDAWLNMKNRCYNKKHPNYDRYGARGIRICKRWEKFENFLADMGKCPDGLTIERINNGGNYSPSNCKWATVQEQSNNKRTNVFLELHGRRMTKMEWARELGMKFTTLSGRLSRGWTVEDALTSPISVPDRVAA